MKVLKTIYYGILLSLVSAPSYAGLWSSTNAVVRPGLTTSMTVSLTGDQRSTDAQVYVEIPVGATVTALTPRLGGVTCIFVPGELGSPNIVRMTSTTGFILPFAQQPLCTITFSASTFLRSGRFIMFNDVCADASGRESRCEFDPGYVSVGI
jgi:hypothetical protein